MTITTDSRRDGVITDVWIKTSWQEFQALVNLREWAEGRFYYDQGYMRIELAPLGPMHGRDNSVVARTISLFATVRGIRIVEFTNTSFIKAGLRGCQPDTSFYIGDSKLPPRNNASVDLNEFDPPSLVLEIASTTLSDDLGAKRLLYERLGVREYWVVNTSESTVVAFEMLEGGSREIRQSKVLVGLDIAGVEEALRRSQTLDDGEVNRWLLESFAREG